MLTPENPDQGDLPIGKYVLPEEVEGIKVILIKSHRDEHGAAYWREYSPIIQYSFFTEDARNALYEELIGASRHQIERQAETLGILDHLVHLRFSCVKTELTLGGVKEKINGYSVLVSFKDGLEIPRYKAQDRVNLTLGCISAVIHKNRTWRKIAEANGTLESNPN